MRPPAEQLIRDYLNRLSVAARSRLKPEDRRAFLARTGDFIERQSGVRGTADPAEVMRILSGIGEPETVVERERVRLEQRRQEQAAKASRVTLWKPRREDAPQASPDTGQLTNKDGRPLTGEIRVTSRPITSRWKPGEPLKPGPAVGKPGRSGRGSWIPRPRRVGSAPPPPDETGSEAPERQPRERPSASPPAPAGSAPAGSPGATSSGSGGSAPAGSPGGASAGPRGSAPAGSPGATSSGSGGSAPAGSPGGASAGPRGAGSPGTGGPGGTTAASSGGATSAGSRGASGGAGPAGSGGAMPAGARNGGPPGSNGTGHIHQVPSAAPAAPVGPARSVPPQAAGPAAGPLTPEPDGGAGSAPMFAGRTLRIGLPGHTVRIGRVPRPSRPVRTRLARSAALQRPRRRLQPGDMTLVLARRAADTGRQHRMEAACVVLMIIAGLIYPFPLWLVGFLIWLVAVVVTTMSTVWSLPDKWAGIVGPVALVIIGVATLISLEGTLATFPDYVHEALADSVWLIKVGAVLGGVFLGWRLQRGRGAPADPPWLRRNSRR
jgi:hypothetical protein